MNEVDICPSVADHKPVRPRGTEPLELPEHLVGIADSQWALWRWVGLRSAGFPAAQMLAFANSQCAAGADRLIQAQDGARQARSLAIDIIESVMEGADTDGLARLEKARRRLQKNKAPDTDGLPPSARAAIDAFKSACAHLEVTQSEYAALFKMASREISGAIREAAGAPGFREAITWQNRQVIHTAINPLLRGSADHNSRRSRDRQSEELIALYLQRYCTKNDTIGFFGPVGWARLNSQGAALTARHGPTLLATRNVYFEVWCIDEIAKALSKNPDLRKWVAPRLASAVRMEGHRLYPMSGKPIDLSPAVAYVLRACNGGKTAKDIASDALQHHPRQLRTEAEVYKLLEDFSFLGLILWNLEAPMDSYPEVELRRLLEPIGDNHLCAQALNKLTELENARDAVADAAGDPERVDRALEDLESTFTRLTGQASTRSAGKTYAGRTLVYEDCRRHTEVEIGPEILSSLGPPLGLLLTSARWLSWETAITYRKAFQELYVRLVGETGSKIVDLARFWAQAEPLLRGDLHRGLLNAIVGKFQHNWAKALNVCNERRIVTYASEQLRPRVLEEFDAVEAGWTYARYHSPDIMIAASSQEAIRQGQYQLVMGEMHVALNTLAWRLFLEQHPSPDEFFRAIDLDLSEPRLAPQIPKYFMGTIPRVLSGLISPKDFVLELTPSLRSSPGSRIIPIGAMVVEDRGCGLVVRTRDGAVSFDIIEAFADPLSYLLSSNFKLLPAAPHTPRIVFDRLVVCRESWHFAASDLDFAFRSESADRFAAARLWVQAHSIPRFVFIKAPVEKKPMYVDFDSSIYVDIFAKVARRTAESNITDRQIRITEMLPRLDQSWLQGPEGEAYTSELRIAALDLVSTARREQGTI